MFSVTALGELLIDFTDAGTSAAGQKLFERNPGGAPANVLVALERLGMSTAFIGKVGQDMHGEFLRATLVANDVNCDGLVMDPNHFTTLAFVALTEDGERTFSFARKPGADTQLTPEELNRDVIEDSRVFHVGSLSLTDEPARSATVAALDMAKAAGAVMSYDPNYRDTLWTSPAAASEQMRSIVHYMDLVKISTEECELLTGRADPEGATAELLRQGVSVACVTLDAEGALVATREGTATVPSFRVDAVDTTGAGDSFWGGFLCAFVDGKLEPSDVTLEDAKDLARFGNAVASLCVRQRGAIPAMPTLAEVEKVLS
ncbi:PfkB family carbohydrate kinase [Olsenella profusa]|uniref:Carbohydrate kinase, PfkB family n=1 Tax=Olsenella profusa F0195 TaxID=1125712 RepID=U2TQS2_9ACTN|nr:PfkB family carbohydrate kinase [Olsenella profusa]ERL08473.1 carbohydrate kinase, PfkB family [Olsenella profusa F0195]